MLWEVEELKKISEIQPEIVEQALKGLWEKNPQLYKIIVINAFIDEKISLSKAAELLNITRLELEKELKEKGIPVRHFNNEDLIAEVEAIQNWKV